MLAQDYPHWDLVVGDNASDLDVAAVVASYQDPRVRYHRFETHVPIDENYNRTALLTRAEWLQLLCADDRLQPNCLSRLAQAIQEASRTLAVERETTASRLSMALTSCRRVYPDGRLADRVWYGSKRKLPVRDGLYDPGSWYALLLEDGHPGWNFGSVAIARHVVEESGGFFRPEIRLSADVEMALRAAAYGHVVYVDEPLLDYTVRSDADNAVRLLANRAGGDDLTPVGAALLAGMRVHHHRRGLSAAERRATRRAIARTHLQRAGQQRILPGGRGRSAALLDVWRALGFDAGTILRPRALLYSLAVVILPQAVLRRGQQQLARRHPE